MINMLTALWIKQTACKDRQCKQRDRNPKKEINRNARDQKHYKRNDQ